MLRLFLFLGIVTTALASVTLDALDSAAQSFSIVIDQQWTIAQSDQPVHRAHQRLLDDAPRGFLGLIKTHGNCAIRPRIVELVAAVTCENNFNADRARSLCEAARLVAQFAGENK